jgi:hypothetical protein
VGAGPVGLFLTALLQSVDGQVVCLCPASGPLGARRDLTMGAHVLGGRPELVAETGSLGLEVGGFITALRGSGEEALHLAPPRKDLLGFAVRHRRNLLGRLTDFTGY